MKRITQKAFFNRPPLVVARDILGKTLLHNGIGGTIVEVEAYHFENDAASHAARGGTPATLALTMGPGTLYIHPMRGRFGLDIVTAEGSLLIRALQPTHGIEEMAHRRHLSPNLTSAKRQLKPSEGFLFGGREGERSESDHGTPDKPVILPLAALTLANGPAKLSEALGITKALYGLNITRPACPLHLYDAPPLLPETIATSPRIGISKNAEVPHRFYLRNNPYVSKSRS